MGPDPCLTRMVIKISQLSPSSICAPIQPRQCHSCEEPFFVRQFKSSRPPLGVAPGQAFSHPTSNAKSRSLYLWSTIFGAIDRLIGSLTGKCCESDQSVWKPNPVGFGKGQVLNDLIKLANQSISHFPQPVADKFTLHPHCSRVITGLKSITTLASTGVCCSTLRGEFPLTSITTQRVVRRRPPETQHADPASPLFVA